MSGHARSSPSYRRVLIALGAVGVTTFAQLYYPQALIPAISRELDVTAADAALTISGATIGLAVAVLGWSWVADRFGRASVMKLALVASVALGLVAPFAPSFEVLIIVRVLQGVALGGTPALALTYLAEEVDRRDAMVAAGTYISGTVIGGLTGRLIAAPIADLLGWRAGALAVGVLSMAGALLAVLLLPTARRFRRPAKSERGSMWVGVVVNLKNPAMLILYAQAFLLMGAHVAIYNYLGYRLEQPPFTLPPAVTAVIFLAGLSGAVSARIAGRLAARFGRRPVLLWSSATMAAGAALTILDWLPTVLLGLLIFTTAYFSAHSIASGWVGPTATTGTAQATSLYSLFYYAGSSAFGWLGGLAFAFGWAGTALVVVAVVLTALACVYMTLLGSGRLLGAGTDNPPALRSTQARASVRGSCAGVAATPRPKSAEAAQ
ncbi:MFS transporter [Acrocarpospora macrocephala]|uniref:MFS transporter n=1 Tax=Acrocarpospora macrocephala TaxID=150177 RepID=A0A5M3WWH4_9ACTN|nr:MFS transporter [Acrocarpospora macrocephala]